MTLSSSKLSRRSFILSGAIAAAAPAFDFRPAHAALTCSLARGPSIKPKPQRAISLRQLSEAAMAGRPAQMDGLTRLDGFIVDRENRDIVLWGQAERGQPSLYFQDFVIALRSASDRYLVRKDGVDYRTTPLISIDPDTEVLSRLDGINLAVPGAEHRRSELCQSPQAVRVEGMPRHTRLAKILVDADYRMKKVSQGVVRLPIPTPFLSVFEARREQGMRKGSGDRHNTRFWFEPGHFSYQYSKEADTFFLDSAKVVLNDEDQYLKGGKLDASGKVDDVSRAFTCAWTARMEEVANAEPIWRDMHHIFRHFALARMMADRNALSRADFAAEFLLDKYELPRVLIPDSLPGIGRVEKRERSEGRNAYTWWQAVCGGVSVGFKEPLLHEADKGEAADMGREVLAARPALTTVAWAIGPGARPAIIERSTPKQSPSPSDPAPKSLRDLFKG